MIDTAPCKPATAALRFRQFVSPQSRRRGPTCSRHEIKSLKDTCDNERAKFNQQFDAIAISVATIEWLSLERTGGSWRK